MKQIRSHNILLDLNLEQIKAYFMMEQCLRIVDYSMFYIAELFLTQ